MTYEVLTYGKSELREKAARVEKVTRDIRQLAKDMLTTMYAHKGLGLAAEQIGRSESICVLDTAPMYSGVKGDVLAENPDVLMPLVLINPEIVETAGEQVGDEGCLSFPDVYVPVTRAYEVKVNYVDLEGEAQSVTACGLLSRAIQHEVDHLEGVLLVDKMTPVQKVAQNGKLKRLKKENMA